VSARTIMLIDQSFWYSKGLPARGPILQVTSETKLRFGVRDAATHGVSVMCLKGVDNTSMQLKHNN
jgi:hypothetical protein